MTPTKKLLTLLAALSLALVPAVALSATSTVAARPASWGPARITIERGDTVRWDNTDGGFRAADHSVMAFGGNWTKNTQLPVGSSTTKRFRDTGPFKFRCEVHSQMVGGTCDGMCGRVRVVRPG